MQFTRKKQEEITLLEKYLKDQGYPQINTALTHYELAINKLAGYAFNGNREIILATIKTISQCENNASFSKQFEFAEKLFSDMEVDIQNDIAVSDYLNNLRVCLNNPIITQNFDIIKPLYLLFEDKKIASGVVAHVKHLENIIEYITEARQFYVDEHALYSAVMSLDKELEQNPIEAIKKQLAQDRENAGIYNVDYDALNYAAKKAEEIFDGLETAEEEIKGIKRKEASMNEEIDRQVQDIIKARTQQIDEVLSIATHTLSAIKNEEYSLVNSSTGKNIGQILGGAVTIIENYPDKWVVRLGNNCFDYIPYLPWRSSSFKENATFLSSKFWEGLENALHEIYPDGFPDYLGDAIKEVLDEEFTYNKTFSVEESLQKVLKYKRNNSDDQKKYHPFDKFDIHVL